MRYLNLGIVAHVDAGKTSLTERLLYEVGVLDELGSVDAGSTRTDTMASERRRGITIRAAVVSFVARDLTVNVIDTPGHSDFIAEVERALTVLDGAVLVVSAVEGVQAQTVVLHRALRRLGIPTVVFVNKIDRAGAAPAEVADQVRRRLDPASLPVQRVDDAGSRSASVRSAPPGDPAFHDALVEVVAAHDDEVLERATTPGPAMPAADLLRRLTAQARQGCALPVLFGSAITGAGVPELLDGVAQYLPSSPSDPVAPPAGVVFKVERGAAGEKLVYLQLARGRIRVRDRVDLGRGRPERVTAVKVFRDGGLVASDEVRAGQVAQLRGPESARIGDRVGAPTGDAHRVHRFVRPSLETVVWPVDPAARARLHTGLSQLAEQDPLINVHQDDERGELAVSLYGEVQKEVLADLLDLEYGVPVRFATSTPLCIERLTGSAGAAEALGATTNPFLATVGLRVGPGPVGSGTTFRLEVERGSMPSAFFTAVEDAVNDTLRQGPHGWQVLDAAVVMTDSGYWARQSHSHGTFDKSMSSTAADFRLLTPVVLMTALLEAGSQVCEPVHRFRLDVPLASQQAVLAALARLDAVPMSAEPCRGSLGLDGTIAAVNVHALQQRLPHLTRGEGAMTTDFDSYRPVHGPPPRRAPAQADPAQRDTYLVGAARAAGRTYPPRP